MKQYKCLFKMMIYSFLLITMSSCESKSKVDWIDVGSGYDAFYDKMGEMETLAPKVDVWPLQEALKEAIWKRDDGKNLNCRLFNEKVTEIDAIIYKNPSAQLPLDCEVAMIAIKFNIETDSLNAKLASFNEIKAQTESLYANYQTCQTQSSNLSNSLAAAEARNKQRYKNDPFGALEYAFSLEGLSESSEKQKTKTQLSSAKKRAQEAYNIYQEAYEKQSAAQAELLKEYSEHAKNIMAQITAQLETNGYTRANLFYERTGSDMSIYYVKGENKERTSPDSPWAADMTVDIEYNPNIYGYNTLNLVIHNGRSIRELTKMGYWTMIEELGTN